MKTLKWSVAVLMHTKSKIWIKRFAQILCSNFQWKKYNAKPLQETILLSTEILIYYE